MAESDGAAHICGEIVWHVSYAELVPIGPLPIGSPLSPLWEGLIASWALIEPAGPATDAVGGNHLCED